MPNTLLHAPRRAALSAAALLAAAVIAACCGSGPGAGGTDPAALVPASAPVYVEAVVRPDGAQAADADGALRRILRTTDPGAELVEMIDRAGRDKGLTWARDIEPWLGERVGAAMPSAGGGRSDGIVVAASTDDDAAGDALAKLIPGGRERGHRDVDVRVAPEGDHAGAVLEGALVLGSEAGVKAAIDASKDDALGETDRLEQARAAVDDERQGFLFIDTERALRASLGAAGDTAQQSIAPFLAAVAKALPTTIAAGIDAEPDALHVESAALGGTAKPAGGDGSAALAALPGDAWLGLGIGDLGASLANTLDAVGSSGGLTGVGLELALRQAGQRLGLDIRRDLLSWMGAAGVFAAGERRSDRRAGIVVTSKDPAATRRAIPKLRALARRDAGDRVRTLRAAGVDEGFVVRGSGDETDVYVVAAGDRFAITTGEGSLSQALRPSGRLGDAPALQAAASKLRGGVKASFFVDVQRARAMKPQAARGRHARRALRAIEAIAGGTLRDGDTTRGRAVATLR
jgi:Protein of unknown function (DUF3352)